MIWIKTDAGRAEMQSRALVKERAQRTLLLLIDGTKSDAVLLASVAGTSGEDFKTLESLGLIAPGAESPRVASNPSPARQVASAAPSAPQPAPAAPAALAELDYAQFTARLTQMISRELGLRGFTLTLAVEKAGTIEELQTVAQRTLDQIRDRKGEAAAASARRTLYGG